MGFSETHRFLEKAEKQLLFRKANKPIAFFKTKRKQKKPWSRTRSKDKVKVKVKDRVKGLDSLRYLRGAICFGA